MKTAIVCGAGIVSGKEIMALELGEGLRERGHEVCYATSFWGDGEFSSRLVAREFPATRMHLGFISATLRWDCIRMTLDQLVHVPGLWWDYTRFLRKKKPEHVIHTNWHHLLMLWPFLRSQRDWFWLHEVVPDKPQYRFVFQRLAQHLRGIIPVSQAVKASLVNIGIPEHQIHVVHNGIADPVAGRKSSEYSRQGIRVGIIGQVARWKGHEDLLEAFARVVVMRREVELHIFGESTHEFAKRLKQRTRELGVESQVVWRGFIPDRQKIYRELDVCVVPSRTADPLPTVAIEAAFFGLPVVASRIGGLPEIIEEEITGLLHAPGNVTELASCLGRLLDSEALRQQMGREARRRAVGHFGLEHSVAEFERLFSDVRVNVS